MRSSCVAFAATFAHSTVFVKHASVSRAESKVKWFVCAVRCPSELHDPRIVTRNRVSERSRARSERLQPAPCYELVMLWLFREDRVDAPIGVIIGDAYTLTLRSCAIRLAV